MAAATHVTTRSRRAVVIGAGLGGIAAALRLAVQGWRVTVCERGAVIGGKMNRWIAGGYTFDTGPSLLTMPWVFQETFAAAGERLEDHVELISMRPIMEAVYHDGTRFIYSNSLPEWESTLRELGPREQDGFYRFMTLGARIFGLSRETFFRTTPTAPPDRHMLRALRHAPVRHAWGNYARTVDAHFQSPYLRQLFNRYPTYVGSSPYRTPATLAVIPYIEYAFGGWYVRGGLYGIVEALASIAWRYGVEFRTGAEVERVATSNGRATEAVLASGERIAADAVIMNGDASCADALVQRRPNGVQRRGRSMSGVVLLIGLRKRLPSMHHHTVYFSGNYRSEFMDLIEDRQFPSEPTVYVSAPSMHDRSIVPKDGEALFIMANAPATASVEWASKVSTIRRRMLDVLRRGGLDILDSDIVCEQMWTPATFEERYRMPGGAIYGCDSHGWRNAFLRPPNRDRSIRNLYYVGGSTHPGGGTPTVLMSAAITTELINRYERS